VHRTSRIVAIAGLSLIAVAVVVLVAWGFYTRETWDFRPGFVDADRPNQSFTGRGLRILMFHPLFEPFAIISAACAVAAGALVYLMIKRNKRWPYLVAAIGTAAAIAVPWLARREVWQIEAAFARSEKWAARSPYVTMATNLAIVATITLALVAISASIAWLTRRKPAA